MKLFSVGAFQIFVIDLWFPIRILFFTFSYYSDLPNNCEANLIIFGGKNTYTTLLGPTRLLISDIFLQNLIFTYINEKKILPTQPY